MTSERRTPATQQLFDANLFDVGGSIRINYSRSSITGQPLLSYKDAELDVTFRGEEVDRVDTPIGELVTVTVQITPDVSDRRISLLVPSIRLPRGEQIPFETLLIETVDRSQSFVAPPGPAGVLQTYRIHQLHGTAQVVDF